MWKRILLPLFITALVIGSSGPLHAKGPAANVNIRLYVTESEITMEMDSDVPVRAIEVAFNNVKQFPDGLQIATPLGNANYELQSSKNILVFLIYEFGTSVIPAGKSIRVFRVYTTIKDPDQITFNRLIIADEDNNEILGVTKSISYTPSSLSAIPEVTGDFRLGQNYPNPFNPSTTIPLTLHTLSHVSLSIYSMNGRRVRIVHDAILEPGAYRFLWDGRTAEGDALPAGTYFYSLTSATTTVTKSMILLK